MLYHATTAKKCTKKRDARAKLLFCQSKPIALLPLSLTSLSSFLKLPNVSDQAVSHNQSKLRDGQLHCDKQNDKLLGMKVVMMCTLFTGSA